ncbi:virulence-associated protein E, partial [Salmonella enterica subsp. enterica]|nr:virulence-associated protein E [Salmonella enterica subsp. enterica serovar Enteritidis]
QDQAGLDAANGCGERWHGAGREVTMAAPLSGDFADRRAA